MRTLLILLLALTVSACTDSLTGPTDSAVEPAIVDLKAIDENQKKANANALVSDVVRIASDAQAWNVTFGGGAGSFSGISFEKMGYKASEAGVHTNLNGKFQLSAIAAETVTIQACDEQPAFDNVVAGVVTGTTPTDIATYVATSSCPF